MATHGMRLMEELKGWHGNEDTLEHRLLAIGSQSLDSPLNIPLESVFQLSQQPSVKLTPPAGSEFNPGEMKIMISLEVGGLSVIYAEGCELLFHVQLVFNRQVVPNINIWKTGFASWEVVVVVVFFGGGMYSIARC